jgi:hypothetical protein
MFPIPSSSPQSANPIPGDRDKPRPRILANLLTILYIMFTLEFGVALLVLPFLSIWENNYLLYVYPQIRHVVVNPFFKGAVLGLGIANILIGFNEIVRFKGFSKNCFSR